MTRDIILKTLNIRYVDLKFTLLFPEDTILSKYKVSALRGGWGKSCRNSTAYETETAGSGGGITSVH